MLRRRLCASPATLMPVLCVCTTCTPTSIASTTAVAHMRQRISLVLAARAARAVAHARVPSRWSDPPARYSSSAQALDPDDLLHLAGPANQSLIVQAPCSRRTRWICWQRSWAWVTRCERQGRVPSQCPLSQVTVDLTSQLLCLLLGGRNTLPRAARHVPVGALQMHASRACRWRPSPRKPWTAP